uniref:Uncharacterized protein n=1 Tax=Cucumis melo TaxID=3656 RepID=A0A9I9E2N9_CUCME
MQCPRQLDSVGCGYYVQNSIPKMHIGKRRLTRFELNGQLLCLLLVCHGWCWMMCICC